MKKEELEKKYSELQENMSANGTTFWALDTSPSTKRWVSKLAADGNHRKRLEATACDQPNQVLVALNFPFESKEDFKATSPKKLQRLRWRKNMVLRRLFSKDLNPALRMVVFAGQFYQNEQRLQEFARKNPGVACWVLGKSYPPSFSIPKAPREGSSTKLGVEIYAMDDLMPFSENAPTLWHVDDQGDFHHMSKNGITVPDCLSPTLQKTGDGVDGLSIADTLDFNLFVRPSSPNENFSTHSLYRPSSRHGLPVRSFDRDNPLGVLGVPHSLAGRAMDGNPAQDSSFPEAENIELDPRDWMEAMAAFETELPESLSAQETPSQDSKVTKRARHWRLP